MDKAPLRRSQQTVHKKWNADIAILSGDTMFVQSCMLMMKVHPDYLEDVMNIFFRTAIEVCEGQQFDMDFETKDNVSINEYIEMIALKTAALIGCSAYIGARCAAAENKDCNHMYQFGKNLGIAFQLHDDILDVYGDQDKFGKQVGGDILANKKTFLMLSALKHAGETEKQNLLTWMQSADYDPEEKVRSVIGIYDRLGIREKAVEQMEHFFTSALNELDAIDAPTINKEPLIALTEKLMIRDK
jgi:geranylgeranyl diphosphate synthase, type II